MAYTVIKGKGETYQIRDEKYSWAIFFINEHGDLFIASDWGYWNFSWRAYNGTFKDFLIGLNDEYFFGKLLVNHNQWGRGRNKVHKTAEQAIKSLFNLFKEVLKEENNLLTTTK